MNKFSKKLLLCALLIGGMTSDIFSTVASDTDIEITTEEKATPTSTALVVSESTTEEPAKAGSHKQRKKPIAGKRKKGSRSAKHRVSRKNGARKAKSTGKRKTARKSKGKKQTTRTKSWQTRYKKTQTSRKKRLSKKTPKTAAQRAAMARRHAKRLLAKQPWTPKQLARAKKLHARLSKMLVRPYTEKDAALMERLEGSIEGKTSTDIITVD